MCRMEVQTMSELKPCPFCGGEASIAKGHDGELLPWVMCRECGAETYCFDSVAEAIEAWNRRAK